MPPARDFYSNSYFAGRVTARPFNERALSVPRQVRKIKILKTHGRFLKFVSNQLIYIPMFKMVKNKYLSLSPKIF